MDTPVRVALRIRPQIPRELINMCQKCTHVTPGEQQVVLGEDKAFTFDYVFDVNTQQSDVYNTCVKRLVEGALNGYNATVLAYGQTGSGKTYTMGTGFGHENDPTGDEGIITRAVRHLFSGIELQQQQKQTRLGGPAGDSTCHRGLAGVQVDTDLRFSVAAQFMELYNEKIVDLLDPFNKSKSYTIHEDAMGGIFVMGATTRPIGGLTDALRCLQQGSLSRSTASTQMNEQSSRSHAIFTILIRRQRIEEPNQSNNENDVLETLTSKFHFVDLAGSERLKRTGATGDRARESIAINSGLLVLGNVISVLGDQSKRSSHVPYRDSKLTRLLQDSLGGNSHTMMIACISSSDCDFMETLNTLKYANRARNIKNRIQVNKDQSSKTISALRRLIAVLQLELLEYKQGIRTLDCNGNSTITDTVRENSMLLAENKGFLQRIKAMQESIDSLTKHNTKLLADQSTPDWLIEANAPKTDAIFGYKKKIEQLQTRLAEAENMNLNLKKYMNSATEQIRNSNSRDCDSSDLYELNFQKSVDENADHTSNVVESSRDDQLECSQKNMRTMRQHYEDNQNTTTERIVERRDERDNSNKTMNRNMGQNSSKEVRQVREEYERKLYEIQREMRTLQSVQKEYIRLQSDSQYLQNQLSVLNDELNEMKSTKIKLVRRIVDESSRHKEAESRNALENAHLRKEALKYQNTVNTLLNQVSLKDQVLKRRSEQLGALKKAHKMRFSTKVLGLVASKKKLNFATQQSNRKWDPSKIPPTSGSTNSTPTSDGRRSENRHYGSRNEQMHGSEKPNNSNALSRNSFSSTPKSLATNPISQTIRVNERKQTNTLYESVVWQ